MTEVCSSPSKANDNYKSKLVNILMLQCRGVDHMTVG